MSALAPSTKVVGGGLGGIVGGVIIDELTNRGHLILTTNEIMFIMVVATMLVAWLIPDPIQMQAEATIESLKTRLDVITSAPGLTAADHAAYTPDDHPIVIPLVTLTPPETPS